MDFLTLLQVLDSTLRLATPLLLVCLAGLFSERSGIFDIGLEGKLLAAAFVSATAPDPALQRFAAVVFCCYCFCCCCCC